MTNYAAEHPPEWLNPLADDATVVPQSLVSRQQIEIAGRRVLGEPLTAQRIITASRSRLGLTLADDAEPRGVSLAGWGHSLPTAVAVLMPLAASITESSLKRARRKFQEKILATRRMSLHTTHLVDFCQRIIQLVPKSDVRWLVAAYLNDREQKRGTGL